MTAAKPDVLVVGAGPVGLTMAAAALRQGLKCRIIDKASVPSDKSKALAVWCRSLELLDNLGLAETFVRTGMKLSGGSMYANGKRLVHLHLTSDESPFGFPLMIPQNETERLLTEHLAQHGVVVERPVELVTFQETPSGVHYTLRHADGREETADVPWVVGCDGAHSTVRHTLGLEFAGHAEPSDWMLADVHIDGPVVGDEVSIFWGERGVLAVFPITRERFRIIADLGPASEQPAKAELTLAEAQAIVNQRGPAGLILSHPVWLAYFRINERKVSDYRVGRAMLAGDAAHIHSPAGGQGMNTGMQDAFNLAWKLALVQRGQGQAEPLLQSYSVERSAVGDRVLQNAERFTTMATLQSPVAQWLRNHIAPILGSFPLVQDRLRDEWFELSIHYRHSPLSDQQWPPLRGGLAAGDRMCDAALTSTLDGRQTTLFQALRGTRHNLLLLPVSSDAASHLLAIADQITRAFPEVFAVHLILKSSELLALPAGLGVQTWHDSTGQLHEKLHAHEPTAIVVRPDGYLGYRSQPANGEALEAYLESYLVRR